MTTNFDIYTDGLLADYLHGLTADQVKLSRAEAVEQEATVVNPNLGLVAHREWTVGDDDYLALKFEDDSVELWRRWDDPQESRLIVQRDTRGNLTYFWAEN